MKFPGNIGELIEQAKNFQENMAKIQSDLEGRIVEGSAGGGMVSARVSGAMKVTGLTIDPVLLEQGDWDMVRDLVIGAVNDGLAKSKEMMKEEMGKLTGGLPIPGM